MSLQELLLKSPHKTTPNTHSVPSKQDTDKVSALIAANKKRAEDILLSALLSLPSQCSSITRKVNDNYSN